MPKGVYDHWKIRGRERLPSTKEKLSELNKGKNNPMYGKKPWNKGLTKDNNKIIKKQSKKLSKILKRLYEEGKIKLPFTKRNKDTSIEIKLQKKLTDNRIIFEKHKSILGQPDIFIEPNICIFADGCYWHSCEQCFDKNKFNGMQRAKIITDQIITQKLINDGYIILRFWEHEINKNIDNCTKRILECYNTMVRNLETPDDRLAIIEKE